MSAPGVVVLPRTRGEVDVDALAAALHTAGTTVVLVDEGVAVDRALRAHLVGALDRGAALASAAAIEGLVAELGIVLSPQRVGPGAVALEPVRIGIGALPAGELVIDAPAPGAVAARRDDVLRHLEAIRGLDADGALVALAVALRREGRRVVRAAEAVVERPRRGLAPRHDGALEARIVPLPARPSRTNVLRAVVRNGLVLTEAVAHPPAVIVVDGETDRPAAVAAALRATAAPIAEIVWSAPRPPRGVRVAEGGPRAFAEAARRRGDRYVVYVDAARPPAAGWLEALVDEVEAGVELAAIADDGVVLLATREVPYHVAFDLGGPATAAERLAVALAAAGRATRDRRSAAAVARPARRTTRPTIGIVYLATGKPSVVRPGLDALLKQVPSAREVVAVTHASSEVARRLLAALPAVRVELEENDPFLVGATNRALARVRTDLVVLATDEAVVTPGLEDAVVRAASARPDVGAFGLRLAVDDPVHGPTDLTPYVDEIAMLRYAAQRAARERGTLSEADALRYPPIVLDRRALDTVGGIDPAFGVSRTGLEDLSLRLRAAGYTLAIVDEAFAHRYPEDESRTLLRGPENAATLVRRKFGTGDAAAIVRAGFQPARDVVRVLAPVAAVAPGEPRVALVCAVDGEPAWHDTAQFVRRAFETWTSDDPVVVAIGVDGVIGAAEVARRVRDLAVRDERPLERTPLVRIARIVEDDWSALFAAPEIVIAVGDRPAFAGLRHIDARGPAALRALVRDPAGSPV